jgi:hypothetical protein
VRAFGAFDLDPCAGPMRHATVNWRRRGLDRAWDGRVWLNPPFSEIHAWVDRMLDHRRGLLLTNARTETQWFQKTAAHARAIFFPRGRLRFTRPNHRGENPPAGQSVFAFTAEDTIALERCGLPGTLLYRMAT